MALKMLRKTDVVRMRQLEHLKDEVRILLAVSHPFVVNLLGHAQDERRLFMLMEYVPGGELFTKLRDEDRFSSSASCFYAAEIALAFEHLHSLGIVYRDLKVRASRHRARAAPAPPAGNARCRKLPPLPRSLLRFARSVPLMRSPRTSSSPAAATSRSRTLASRSASGRRRRSRCAAPQSTSPPRSSR